jgi:hypothetical protein
MQGVVTFFWAGAREDGWLRCARHDGWGARHDAKRAPAIEWPNFGGATAGENQKFFASFFQKRSAFLLFF